MYFYVKLTLSLCRFFHKKGIKSLFFKHLFEREDNRSLLFYYVCNSNCFQLYLYLYTMIRTEKIKNGPVSIYLLYYDNFIAKDYFHFLLPDERAKAQSIKHPLRKREFVATRVLRTLKLGQRPVLYNEIGAPYMENEGFISISHARCAVGLAHCNSFRVGLDLEEIDEKVMRVKHKFLSEEEKKATNTSSVEEMIKVWSGKETLYKLAERKQIIFAENLLLTPISDTDWKGKIYFPENKKEVDLKIYKKNNFVISYNTAPAYEIY